VIVDNLRRLAKEKGVAVATLALAWLMHRSGRKAGAVIPIPSSKSRNHFRENIAAASLALSAEDLARIDAACPPGAMAA
jgi:aryl-alcohol dehydrogenase-like predicted oxidoreductase